MLIGAPVDLMCNTAEEIRVRNAEINRVRDVRKFSTQPERAGEVCIVGGGPSLKDCLDLLRMRKASGQQVWATNNVFSYLVANGITPDVHVLLDSRPDNLEFLKPTHGVTYYLHECCDPSLFEALEGYDVVLYSLNGVDTGSTVGLKALYLAGFSGFRNFHLFGFDSSYRDSDHHAYGQSLNDKEKVIEVRVEDEVFKCAPWMAVQAEEFQQIAQSMAAQGCTIAVAGDGLLPHIAHRMAYVPKILTAVWDLMLCPTGYDFACFLNEAERKRVEMQADAIDLVIQPGPRKGFREDDLPPNLGAREGMLYRVIVGMARLLPSIRNIEIIKARRHVIADHVFPEGYSVNEPKTQYGQHYAQYAQPIFRATEAAREFVAKRETAPYITITLREASHWTVRNSNKAAWLKVAHLLRANGYEVVWVPDAESPDANLFSFDIDMRLALYEKAVLNLGVNNGPMHILPFTNASYIIFKIVTESVPWTSRAFHEKWGTKEGLQPGGRGTFVYESDDYETIVQWIQPILNQRKIA